jgi:cytidyltransferase-like protein
MSNPTGTTVILCGSFDNMRAPYIRLLDEARGFGVVHVYLWDDITVEALTGEPPKFPLKERLYYVQAICYVTEVTIVEALDNADHLPASADVKGQTWVVPQDEDTPAKQAFAQAHGVTYQTVTTETLATYPAWDRSTISVESSGRPKVLVTGCYDWFHTGHVRFFEEVSELGDLYVVVGHDANIEKLKGEGHPMFKEDERRYIASSIRYVTQALISTGDGWLDAEPEIQCIKPDMYAVNEDGDKPVKQEYCQANGIKYVVLKRLPKPGLTRRESTHLRGF